MCFLPGQADFIVAVLEDNAFIEVLQGACFITPNTKRFQIPELLQSLVHACISLCFLGVDPQCMRCDDIDGSSIFVNGAGGARQNPSKVSANRNRAGLSTHHFSSDYRPIVVG